LFIFIILTHETFGFFTLPLLFLLSFNYYKGKKIWERGIFSFIILSPSIFAFLFVLSQQGNQEIALTIWNSWQTIPDSEIPVNSLQAIGWNTIGTLKLHILRNFFQKDQNIYTFFNWCIIFPAVYYLVTNFLLVFKKKSTVYTENHKTTFSSIFLFQLLCLLPLFTVLSIDYVRLFFYLSTTSFAAFLIIQPEVQENLFPSIFYKKTEALNRRFELLLPPSKTIIALLMLTIGIANCSDMIDYTNSVIYQILFVFSELISFAISAIF
jgi:hypothetical protein